MLRNLILSALVAAALGGCGFPAGLAKCHEGLKVMSKHVEPPLAGLCLDRARKCHKDGDRECKALAECRAWKADYVSATKATHTSLAAMNRLYLRLKKQGVIE